MIINQTIVLQQTPLFYAHFLEYLMLVLDDKMNEKVYNFRIENVQPQAVA